MSETSLNLKSAYFAAGCFWGVEKYFQKHTGVKKTSVGFMGGSTEAPTYEDICKGDTGHAEVVLVEYNELEVTYRELVIFLFRMHDPTTLNQQHNDKGTQYRSAIFTNTDSEIKTIKDIISKLEELKVFTNKVVTSIESNQGYFPASELHQNYLIKNPGGYMCHMLGPELPFK
ncbi:peptide-methionine (S)-S-oxide reductase [Halobacteriovorax marinus]|uniref:Peptide methionine sulfoxide reductase MsrA n=1 Tax=Halobacteriovorax marinus TaxID=97084 RepID=A0A1Y5F9M7_9BACT|nr:peptide-methionine (S)-S-oxide reductase [Halobacteriovorax marinus]